MTHDEIRAICATHTCTMIVHRNATTIQDALVYARDDENVHVYVGETFVALQSNKYDVDEAFNSADMFAYCGNFNNDANPRIATNCVDGMYCDFI